MTYKGVVKVPVFLTEWAVKLNAVPSNTIQMKAKPINVNSLKKPVPLQAMCNATKSDGHRRYGWWQSVTLALKSEILK